MAATKLAKYQEMRDFSQTAEPSGQDAKVVPSEALRFVIQKHAASHLHFDLRLEYEGTFRTSFLIDPKGKIAAVYENVKPELHVDQVLTDLKSLLK